MLLSQVKLLLLLLLLFNENVIFHQVTPKVTHTNWDNHCMNLTSLFITSLFLQFISSMYAKIENGYVD